MAATQTAHKQEKPIVAEIRKERGSRRAQIIRAQGKIPAVIYGLRKDPVSVVLPASEAVSVLRSGAHIMDIALSGGAAAGEKMLIQDVQYDYLQAEVEHIDLLRI